VLLSIIIPTFNEAENMALFINLLQKEDTGELLEIIVVDGQSTDNTMAVAIKCGVKVVASPVKGRAAQMNYGASFATTNILYFLHADSIPPKGFIAEILEQIKNGFGCGCFRLQFDHLDWFLKANAWFTRFDFNAFRFGDQSLFVLKDTFTKAGGFKEKLIIMEDQEIIHRLKKFGKFTVMKPAITTSSRKYIRNGIYKTQGIFFLIYFLYKINIPQSKLVRLYQNLIK
jgi:rSAM/selenodomain-associated transferase 2